MSIVRNRELSQFASFIHIDDDTKNIGITTEITQFVGIGTINPQYKLDVSGDINIEGDLYQNGSIFVTSRWTAGTGDDIFRLNGDVGIGTTNPQYKLDVSGDGNFTGNIIATNILPSTDNTGAVGNTSFTWNNGQFTNLTVNDTLDVRSAIDVTDNVILRFGTGDDWELFHNGTSNFMDLNVGNLIIRDNTTTRFTFERTTGNLITTGTITANSDEKLKENVITIENALKKVLSLRGVEYDRIDNGDHQIGVIAQEVEKIVPAVVYGDEIKSVAYANMVGLLIEAIKEQQKEIEELKNNRD
jgi:hypothetical protein